VGAEGRGSGTKITITPDGRLTATDATVADVEQAIRQWRGERQAERERAEVARLEAAGLARWEAMTPHPKHADVRCDAFGVAWKFEASRWRRHRELSPVGWAPGARVRVTGGRVAHVAGMGLQYCHRCGAYFSRGSSVAPDGMRLCGEKP